MKLHIKDRLYIPSLFLKEGSYMDYTIKQGILKKIAITEDDKSKYNLQQDANNERITWDVEKDYENPLDVTFNSMELDYLKRSCEAISDVNKPDDVWQVVDKIYSEAV